MKNKTTALNLLRAKTMTVTINRMKRHRISDDYLRLCPKIIDREERQSTNCPPCFPNFALPLSGKQLSEKYDNRKYAIIFRI